MQKDLIFKKQEIKKQSIIDDTLIIIKTPNNQYQVQTITKNSNTAHERYGIWMNSSLLENSDIVGE